MASGVVKINAQLKTLALITLKAHIAETHRIIIAVCIVFLGGGFGREVEAGYAADHVTASSPPRHDKSHLAHSVSLCICHHDVS